MKKNTKKKNNFVDKEFTLIVDPELNKLKGKNLAPEKLALANKLLSRMKTLPK